MDLVRGWLLVWAPFLLAFALGSLSSGDWRAVEAWLPQASIGVAGGLLLSLRPRLIAEALVWLLLLAGIASLLLQWDSTVRWQPVAAGSTRLAGVGSHGPAFRIGRGDSARSGQRAWLVPEGAESLSLSLEARLVSGQPGWDWRSPEPEQLQPVAFRDGAISRWTTGGGDGEFIARRFDGPAPLAGSTVRAHLTMRAPEARTGRTCGSIRLADADGSARRSSGACLGPEWREHVASWRVPDLSSGAAINVALHGFEAVTVEIADLRVYARAGDGGRWRRLGPPDPLGMALALEWNDGEERVRETLRLLPGDDWTTYELSVAGERLPSQGATRVLAAVLLERSLEVEVRAVSLTSLPAGGPGPVALPASERLRYGLDHENLAGHSAASLGLAALAVAPTIRSALIVPASTLLVIWSTGSRTAFYAFLVGSALLVGLALWRRTGTLPGRTILAGGVVAAALASAAILVAGEPGRLATFDGGPKRVEIWTAAVDALERHPWTGIGFEDPATPSGRIAETVSGPGERTAEAPAFGHFHNLWLHLAALHGLPGLLAALLLSGGLAYLGWNWGRARGLVLVLTVLALQLTDYTLFFTGVLFPLLLGMNGLRAETRTGKGS